MIGQQQTLTWVDNNKDNFPHFVVITGSRGSGKRTLAKEIARTIGCVYSETEIKVDSVRDVIDSAYKSATDVLYCFADADTMRAEAKNAMLKITEEPPKHAYFVLTVCDDSTLLDTIKSRATVIEIAPYTKEQILDYADYQYDCVGKGLTDIVYATCDTIGDVDRMFQYDVKEFYDFVNLVIDNIQEVEPANAFKSGTKLALKGDEGYDLELFWNCAVAVWSVSDKKDAPYNMLVTCLYLDRLQKVGVNKQQLYDGWVLAIRGNKDDNYTVKGFYNT